MFLKLFRDVFKVKMVRNKILFIIFIFFVFCIGMYIIVLGINVKSLE